jgi:pentatricopeptide repeat protein
LLLLLLLSLLRRFLLLTLLPISTLFARNQIHIHIHTYTLLFSYKPKESYCDAVLGLCVAHEEWESVLEVLDIMKEHNLEQTKSTYRACLQACLQAGNGQAAKDIFQAMEKALFVPDPYDVGLCVTAMCRQDQFDKSQDWWRKALVLLKTWAIVFGNTHKSDTTMLQQNDEEQPTITIPLQAYHVILERMVDSRQWKEAVRLLRMMEDSTPVVGSIEVTTTTRPTPATAATTTAAMVGLHPSPDVIAYREVIECCIAANQAEQAAQVLYSMRDRGVKPSSYACELVIGGLAKKLQWRRGLQLLELMTEMNIPKTVITYNTIISACARAQEVGMAKSLLARMQNEGIRPDEVSFNSVIGACASTARWKDALSLLDQCYREPGVTPNIYIYTNAMR